MKTCPVCQARTFDDAEVCYGCMHRFGGSPVHERLEAEAGWEPDDAVARPAADRQAAAVAIPSKDGRQERPMTRLEMVEAAQKSENARCEKADLARRDAAEPLRHEGKHALFPEGERGPGAPLKLETTRRDAPPNRPADAAAPAKKGVRGGWTAGGAAEASDGREGWIVRFELPGVPGEAAAGSYRVAPSSQAAAGGFVARGSGGAPCSLVVSIAPASADEPGGPCAPATLDTHMAPAVSARALSAGSERP